jgi:hypothetical protein
MRIVDANERISAVDRDFARFGGVGHELPA